MRKTILTALMLVASLGIWAEGESASGAANHHFVFEVYGDIPDVKPTFEEQHPLGKVVSDKWNTFIANYTCVYDVEVGLSGSATEIRKPAVFKAVGRADKYIRKQVRDGAMGRETAVAIMTHILDCANVICFDDETAAFEAYVRKAKTGQDVVDAFASVELKQM
ncbi:MAG: hypothetical protein ACI3Y5_01950 [Prevotella sp.]